MKEYETDDLADNDDDEKRILKAADKKVKKRRPSGRFNQVGD